MTRHDHRAPFVGNAVAPIRIAQECHDGVGELARAVRGDEVAAGFHRQPFGAECG